jgi:hypothetical protein
MIDCNNGLLIRGHCVQRPVGSCSVEVFGREWKIAPTYMGF